MNKAFYIFKKTLKQILRNHTSLALVFLIPVIFFASTGFVFSFPQSFTQDIVIGIASMDQGVTLNVTSEVSRFLAQQQVEIPVTKGFSFSNFFIQEIQKNPQALVNETSRFQVKMYTKMTLEKLIRTDSIDMGVTIPKDFSDKILQGIYNAMNFTSVILDNKQNKKTNITVIGDPARQRFQIALTTFTKALTTFQEWLYGIKQTFIQEQVMAVETKAITIFDWLVPGYMAFSMLLLIPTVAALVTGEKERDLLKRLYLANMTTQEYLSGILLAFLVTTSLQFILILGVIRMFHFHAYGSFFIAYVTMELTMFTMIGIGFVVASFARTSFDAIVYGAGFSTPFAFLSGALIPFLPHYYLIPKYGIEVWVVIPTYHTTSALRKVLLDGLGWGAITSEIFGLVITAIVWLLIGLVLFRKQEP